jgi:hypothetical protein
MAAFRMWCNRRPDSPQSGYPVLLGPWRPDVPLPLSSFQICEATHEGTQKLVRTLALYQQRQGLGVYQNVERLHEYLSELEDRLIAIRNSCGVGLVMPYRIPARLGLQYDTLIDAQTRELVIVGQNLQGLLRDNFFDRIHDCLIERPDFRTLVILAVPEYFNALTVKPAERQEYSAQFKNTIRRLKALRSSLSEAAQGRLRVIAHPGACSLSAIFCDPSDPKRGLAAFTPKWATDQEPDNRITCIVRRSENEVLFGRL